MSQKSFSGCIPPPVHAVVTIKLNFVLSTKRDIFVLQYVTTLQELWYKVLLSQKLSDLGLTSAHVGNHKTQLNSKKFLLSGPCQTGDSVNSPDYPQRPLAAQPLNLPKPAPPPRRSRRLQSWTCVTFILTIFTYCH